MTIISPAPRINEIFNEDYDRIGHYVQDGDLLPYYNPKNSGIMVLPGGPMLIQWAGGQRAFLSQGPIREEQVGYLVRPGRWVAQLPCVLTADVVVGDELYWDVDTQKVSLVGDVANGFVVGYATYSVDPNWKNNMPKLPVDGNGRVICGTSASGNIVIASENQDATVKGTSVVAY